MNTYTGLEIAVIGMAGRFPGAQDIDRYWENIRKGKESIKFFTEEELYAGGESEELIKNPQYVNAGGILDDKEYFDASFFNYRPDEARLMDPQIRIFHECVWNALENAGCDLKDPKARIGLFAGATNNTNWQVYAQIKNQQRLVDPFTASRLSSSQSLATLISYTLNLKGPSIFVDTACSTSLVAIHMACKSLLLGECKVAVAGGVTLTHKSTQGYLYEEGMIFSRDGHCKTFDADSSGTVGGEGAGAVVLKPLKKAIEEGDHIWAIIKGSGINNDGQNKVAYTAPSVNGQMEAIMAAQKWGKVSSDTIGMVEAHGTATYLGDPIEIEALNRAFSHKNPGTCAIGSIKSNIGHLDAAAGVAGFIKAALAIHHQELPPSLHFKTPNPNINFQGGPFYVNKELKKWDAGNHPRRAGVSSFGIGGTNAHVILEEAPPRETSINRRNQEILVFSAHSKEALHRNIEEFGHYLRDNPKENLGEIAYTLIKGRTDLPYRKSLVCQSKETTLASLPGKDELERLQPLSDQSKATVVFMFSGQGFQYVNMFYDLYQTESLFKQELDNCLKIIEQFTGSNMKEVLFGKSEKGACIHQTQYAQPLLFAVEYALAQLLISWGIQPDMMIGHSLGEYTAACISGLFSLKETVGLVVKRGELMQSAKEGDMLSVSLSEEALNPFLEHHEEVSLAVVNSTELCVVSGNSEAIDSLKKTFDERDIKNRKLKTSHAFHSYMMDEVVADFRKEVDTCSFQTMKLPFISNVTGEPAKWEEVAQGRYWADHIRQTVRFSDGIEHLLGKENLVFLEVGPGNSLCSFVKSHRARKKQHKVISLARHPKDPLSDLHFLLKGLGEMWEVGLHPNWDEFYKGQTLKKVALPGYSFDKISFPVFVDASKILAGRFSENENAFDLSDFDSPGDNSAKIQSITDTEENIAGRSNQDALEQKLISLWEDFFGKDGLDKYVDFFEIGGDSLKALTMINRLNQQFHIELVLRDIFDHSNIKQLASFISKAESVSLPPIPRVADNTSYNVSPEQERLYYQYLLNRESDAFNLSNAFKVRGDIQVEKLREAFQQLIQRHEGLRTSFSLTEEGVVQHIHEAIDFRLELIETEAEDSIHDAFRKFVRPFNLAESCQIRVGFCRDKQEGNYLFVDFHHIIADGLSLGILVRDFQNIYLGQELDELKLRYVDYAHWIQTDTAKIDSQRKFWKEKLSGELPRVDLPAMQDRDAVDTHLVSVQELELSEAICKSLKEFSVQENVSDYMFLLAIYYILLSKISGDDDIIIGTEVLGRTHPDLSNVVGTFINVLPLRVEISPEQSFGEFLQEVKEETLAAFEHQDLPFNEMVSLVEQEDRVGNPIFDAYFSFANIVDPKGESEILDFVPVETPDQIYGEYEFSLDVTEKNGKMIIQFIYSRELYENETIELLRNYYHSFIIQAITDKDRLIETLEMEEILEEDPQYSSF